LDEHPAPEYSGINSTSMISKHLYHLSILIFILGTCSVFAQESDFIKGQLLDAKTGEPVVFATIRVKGKAKGVISNQDGGFRVPKKFKDLGDVLVISSMGYTKHEMPILGLSSEHINIIRLKPGVMTLSEAVVSAKKKRKLSARRIVRKAIKAIPENFPNDPFSTIGYYRDYQLEKQSYVNLNEAIFEVFDKGFAHNDHNTSRVKIYDYRKNIDFPRDTLAQKPYDYQNWNKVIENAYLWDYGGNEFTILRIHDAIRNHNIDAYSFVHKMDTDLLANHKFLREPETFLEDEAIYVIRFEKTLPGYYAYEAIGRMYISRKDFAIHKMEYALYINSKQILAKQDKRANRKQLIFEVSTEYLRRNKQMFLNYISFHNSFQTHEPPKFIVEYITVDAARRCFVVSLNNFPDHKYALLEENYLFKFKGKKLDFKKLEINIFNKKEVLLYPRMYPNKADAMFREFDIVARKNELVTEELLSAEVKNLVDVQGNLLNQPFIRYYNQFREFFVQQVIPNNSAPIDSLFMKKSRPIFKDQPILKPDNFEDYWMNSPLQNSEE
jgi:carboxypeptidase-like protein